MVAPPRTVGVSASRDIEDGAIDDKIDGERRICAVVDGQLGGCEVYRPFLRERFVSVLIHNPSEVWNGRI